MHAYVWRGAIGKARTCPCHTVQKDAVRAQPAIAVGMGPVPWFRPQSPTCIRQTITFFSRARPRVPRSRFSPTIPREFSGENLPIQYICTGSLHECSLISHACMHASGPSPTAPSLSALALRGAEISLGSRLLQLQTCLRAHCTVDSSASIGRPTGRCLAEPCLLVCRIHESCACSCMRAIRATEVYSELTRRQLLERAVQRR